MKKWERIIAWGAAIAGAIYAGYQYLLAHLPV
jgi:hypothetical protein